MITPLSAARIVGNIGLAGGTITSSAYAVKYGGQVRSAKNTEIQSQANMVNKEWDVRSKKTSIQAYIKYAEYEKNTLTQCVKKETMPVPETCSNLLSSLTNSLNQLKT